MRQTPPSRSLMMVSTSGYSSLWIGQSLAPVPDPISTRSRCMARQMPRTQIILAYLTVAIQSRFSFVAERCYLPKASSRTAKRFSSMISDMVSPLLISLTLSRLWSVLEPPVKTLPKMAPLACQTFRKPRTFRSADGLSTHSDFLIKARLSILTIGSSVVERTPSWDLV